MALIAYLGAHGCNDFPLHVAFFSELERRGLLDKFDFALDTLSDLEYCIKLKERFPQLKLTEEISRPRRWMRASRDWIGRGYGVFGRLDRFDAVCEAPGGRINECYLNGSLWNLYPNAKRRAILFHSIESGALERSSVRQSVAESDLVIARTRNSAANARNAGAKRVCEACDVVFLDSPGDAIYQPGYAVALRLPNKRGNGEYMGRIRDILHKLGSRAEPIDLHRVEEPIGTEMRLQGFGSYLKPRTGLYADDTFYRPFLFQRDAVISSRLHTTLIALLSGNRRLLQFQIEEGTNKIAELLDDIGLRSIEVLCSSDVTWDRIERFLGSPPTIPESEVQDGLAIAHAAAVRGMDELQNWLESFNRLRPTPQIRAESDRSGATATIRP
jgi:hypothetical protein